MGAKTALLAFVDGDLRPALLGAVPAARAEARQAVRRIHPGYQVEWDEETTLDDTNPADDVTNVAVLAGAEIFGDRRLVLDRPSELPQHLLALGAGRRIVMHGMHSAVDWLCFAVWEDGRLVRSLSLSPDSGIVENIGEPYAFELPYWAGEHPVDPESGWPDDDEPYPLPFHPLELGEDALRELFGFVLEGMPEPGDVDVTDVHMHSFRVTDPTGAEQAAREAEYARIRAAMGPPRLFRVGPDGRLHEVGLDER
ncbi:DUF6928 family protein [Catellatospora citrea]|uniref:Uncharacterized protein n=1 Tax=Catellatospora citrea TaxID=53366 RepID=A0A8J3KCN5_9ACTN|nr:hypothetical protein [Catellatospora citrea]RKE05898.1 hypothetical protein C8E86_0712 [Catellatospora citrea]GIF97561.1 hypothetical protein Cci01nite_26550 [Catellatospora citrea]